MAHRTTAVGAGAAAEPGEAAAERRHRDQPSDRGTRSNSPDVDVRVVLFAVVSGRLAVRLVGNGGLGRLPRGNPTIHDTLDRDARRIVRDQTGLHERYLEQLYTLGIDEGGWKIIVSYLGLIRAEETVGERPSGDWHDVEKTAPISEADRNVIAYALVRLRAKLGYTTIAFHLLSPTFTLRELQDVYEAVLARPLDKRNFRRRVIAAGFLESTGAMRREGSHRPAHLYRFKAVHDPDTYLTPPWAQGT